MAEITEEQAKEYARNLEPKQRLKYTFAEFGHAYIDLGNSKFSPKLGQFWGRAASYAALIGAPLIVFLFIVFGNC